MQHSILVLPEGLPGGGSCSAPSLRCQCALQGSLKGLFAGYREAGEVGARARAAAEAAASAVRGARAASARLRGKEDEVTLADLHAVAAARLDGWNAWVDSRNTFDEGDEAAEVGLQDLLFLCKPSLSKATDVMPGHGKCEIPMPRGCVRAMLIAQSRAEVIDMQARGACGVRRPKHATTYRCPETCAVQEEEDALKPVAVGFRLDGCEGAVAAHVGYAREGARSFALVSLAAAEAFPSGALDGAVFHWGVASREGGAWAAPPDGWQSDPARTEDAGNAIP